MRCARTSGSVHHAISSAKMAGKTPLKADVARKRTTSLLFLRVVDEPLGVSTGGAPRSSDCRKRQRVERAGLTTVPTERGRRPLRNSRPRARTEVRGDPVSRTPRVVTLTKRRYDRAPRLGRKR